VKNYEQVCLIFRGILDRIDPVCVAASWLEVRHERVGLSGQEKKMERRAARA
jgi:hypothetical protein